MALTSPHQDSHHNRLVLMIVGGVLLLIVLLVMGGLYGSFLKTTVAPGSANYEKSGQLKTQGLDAGNYTLNFSGRDTRGGVVAASTTFEITETAIGEVTTPTPVITPTATPINNVVTDGEVVITPTPTATPSVTLTPVNQTAITCSTPNNTLVYSAAVGSSVQLTATLLRKDNGQPVSNASIRWFDPSGIILATRSLTNSQGVATTTVASPAGGTYMIAEYSLADQYAGAPGDAVSCRMTITPANS